ncbi:MAG: hypothetical protein NT045_00410 [Candidatus Aureabacteria bacterium]|nr:hypothetical protein [Candidatus Auribacterota bacterium]
MNMKRCPYCAEDVKAEAIVCRYCARNITVKPLSQRRCQWVYVNNVIGSVIFFTAFFTIFFAAIAEYTGIGGAFAPLAEPFTPIRNEIAKGYAALGAVIGFAIGIVHGTMTAKLKIARLQGEEVVC